MLSDEAEEMRERRKQRRPEPVIKKEVKTDEDIPQMEPTSPPPDEPMPRLPRREDHELKAVMKHPVTKIALVFGGLIACAYLSSYFFKASAKAAASFHQFWRAAQG